MRKGAKILICDTRGKNESWYGSECEVTTERETQEEMNGNANEGKKK